jgi:hypothetical protein
VRARGQTGGALAQGQTYVVARGDTLSGIAARVADRPGTIRQAAAAIFASNPDAFARGNPDLLQAGRALAIPALSAPPATPATSPMAGPATAPLPVSAPPGPAAAPGPVEIPPTAEPPAGEVTIVLPVASPAASVTIAESGRGAATAARSSVWLPVLLALGAALVASVPLLLIRRRRKQDAAPPAAAMVPAAQPRRAPAAQPRRLVDPVAGFDVVEGPLTDIPAGSIATTAEAAPATARPAGAAQCDPLAIELGPVDSVDLDVGAPIIVGERVDTIVEVEMLRQDYEAEHTLTQAANQELRDAVAVLEATQATRAASAETATLEIPQAESIELTQPHKLRSSR